MFTFSIVATNDLIVHSAIQEDYTENEQVYFLLEQEQTITKIQTKTILDDRNALHLFVQVRYDNGTFVIYHVHGNQTHLIVKEENVEEIFEVSDVDDGVQLIFAYRGSTAYYDFKLYTWTYSSEGEVTPIFSTNPRWQTISFWMYEYEEEFHLIIGESVPYSMLSERTYVRVWHFSIDSSSNIDEDSWKIYIDYPNLQKIFWVNGSIYAFFLTPAWGDGYRNHTIIRTSQEDNTIVSQWISTEGEFDTLLDIEDNKMGHYVLLRNGKLYSCIFPIESDVNFTMFNEIDIEVYKYQDLQIQTLGNNTYVGISSGPYMSYENFFSSKEYNADIVIVKANQTDISKESISLSHAVPGDIFSSFSMDWRNLESYVFCRTTLLSKSYLDEPLFYNTSYISFLITSNLELNLPERAIYYYIEKVTAFSIFWQKAGMPLTIVIASIGLIYLIFFKWINRIYANIKKFLTRPVYQNTKKAKLVALNFWLFIFNFFTTLFILFKANKRRYLVSILGLSVLAIIIITSAILYDSKQQNILIEYTEQIDLTSNNLPSFSVFYPYENRLHPQEGTFDSDFPGLVFNEVFETISRNTVSIEKMIVGFEYSTSIIMTLTGDVLYSSIQASSYVGLSKNYLPVIESLLIEGRAPEEKGEIILTYATAISMDTGVGENITCWGTNYIYHLGSTYANFTIVGIFATHSVDLKELCSENNVPYDVSTNLLDMFCAFTFNDFYLESISEIEPLNTMITMDVQLIYDFNLIELNEISNLKNEINGLILDNQHSLKFAPSGWWTQENEFIKIINIFEPNLASSQFLFYTLAVPVLFLALFLVFETNELFTSSFEQEIDILQSKGESIFKIGIKYTSFKFVESLIATFIGLGGALILVPLLLKIDNLLSFKSTFYSISFSYAQLAMVFSFFSLVLVSLPKVIQLSKGKGTVDRKAPRRLSSLLKKIKRNRILLVLIGGGIVAGAIFLRSFLEGRLDPVQGVTILMSFVYMAGIGILILLLGVGLLIKDIHNIIMIVLSKVVWAIRKTIQTFSLVEIRSDVELFNNIFLSYITIFAILIPSFVVPITIQYNYEKDAYFSAGSDLYVKYWNDQNITIQNYIEDLSEVESVANVSLIDTIYKGKSVDIYAIDNIDEFTQTAYRIPKKMYRNWETDLPSLKQNTTMIVSEPFQIFVNQNGDNNVFKFIYDGSVSEGVEFNITGDFDYFPVFHAYGPYDESVTSRKNALVMTQENFDLLGETFDSIIGTYRDRLLINLVDECEDHKELAEQIAEKWDIEVVSAKEEAEDMRFNTFPFYSVIVAEFVFALLVCVAAIIFISVTNPIKLLSRRAAKYDKLMKMGISKKRIIRMTAFEIFVAGLLPGLAIGTLAGFGLMQIFLYMINVYFYEGINYLVKVPLIGIILSFILAPVLFYTLYYATFKANFARYQPQNME